LADANGLTFRGRFRAQYFGGQRFGRRLGSPLKRKQLVDRYLQLARKIQCNFGVGNVRPGFDRIDRLAAYSNAARQVRGAHTPALSNLAQPILDARLHKGYFLT
jgi:hypothetical protein